MACLGKLRCLALLSVVWFAPDASAASAPPPNIVWIIADDMSPDTAAYGMRGVNTPHLDRLAAQGRRYERAYASAPVCSSSRSAFILGTYQTTTGLHAHDVENPQPLAAPYRHLPELLREAGWFVTNAAAPGTVRNGRVITRAKTHYNFAHDPATMYDGSEWRKRRPGQPFFAQFQITEPHRPFPIPEQFDEVALRAVELPANYPDHPLVRRDWYAYQRSVEMVDRRVGAILAELEREGVLDNTLVMFFADHGRPMPWGKQWLTVEGLQVPLLVQGPGVAAGSVESRLVSLIDLAPTALALAGRPIPVWMHGQPLLGETFPERSQLFAARDRCGDAADRIRAVITPERLFVRNFEPGLSRLNWSGYKEASYPGLPLLRVLHATGRLDGWAAGWLQPARAEYELYDLRSDPAGLRNVAAEPARQDALARHRQILDDWITASADRGVLPDPATEPSLPEIQRAKRADYQRSWQARLKKPEPTDAERVAWWEKTYRLTGP
jgi:N-sulfoglucosamine sulfohydrolase